MWAPYLSSKIQVFTVQTLFVQNIRKSSEESETSTGEKD